MHDLSHIDKVKISQQVIRNVALQNEIYVDWDNTELF